MDLDLFAVAGQTTRRDAWARHFVWDGLRIRSVTSTGRTTAWLLEFNSEERIKLRQGLRKLGLF